MTKFKKYLYSRLYKFRKNIYKLSESSFKIFCLSYIFVTLFLITNNWIYLLSLVLLIYFSKSLKLLILPIAVISYIIFLNYQSQFSLEKEKVLNTHIKLSTTVIEDPRSSEYKQELVLKAEGINGLILAKVDKFPKIQKNDLLEIEGKLMEPKNLSQEFDYKFYLSTKKILYEFNGDIKVLNNRQDNLITGIRSRLKEDIVSSFTISDSNLFSGILFGFQSDFSEQYKNNLRNSGLYHIVSVSGSNFTFIYLGIISLSGILNRKVLQLTAIPVLITYLILVGFENIPALRATIMILITILAALLGRKISVINLILISIVILLLEYPLYWFNISFILSFSALLGIVFLNKPISLIIKSKFKFPSNFLDILSSTIAVLVFTSLITIIFFESFSLISLISNIIVLPIIPIIMVLGLIFIFFKVLELTILYEIFALVLSLLLKFVNLCINFLGKVESEGSLQIALGISFMLILLGLIIYNDYKNFK